MLRIRPKSRSGTHSPFPGANGTRCWPRRSRCGPAGRWKQIQERLKELRAQTEVIFTLDTLEYLAKGGRIGRVQALAGTLLHLKPVISVDHHDGKYNNVGRSRSLPRALQNIASQLHHVYADAPLWVTVMHGKVAEQAEDSGARDRRAAECRPVGDAACLARAGRSHRTGRRRRRGHTDAADGRSCCNLIVWLPTATKACCALK